MCDSFEAGIISKDPIFPKPDVSNEKIFKTEKLSMDELVEELHRVFSQETADVDELMSLMGRVDISHKNWKKFEYYDQYRYTRNLVNEGNGKFNLIVLCWGLRHGSGIHDHMGAHCIVKILNGELKEDIYEWPKENENSLSQKMQLRTSNIYKTGEVTYIHDKIGLHRVENPSHSNPLVSLHLYCPPFVECHNFDETSSKVRLCGMNFISKLGNKPDAELLKRTRSQVFDEPH